VKSITAVYEDGVFKPEQPVDLEERAQVRLLVERSSEAGEGAVADWQAIDEVIASLKDGPQAAVGRNHDEYLYRRR
jgi:predicted DNA-binding antitoxin AbrB/MazE fold protein